MEAVSSVRVDCREDLWVSENGVSEVRNTILLQVWEELEGLFRGEEALSAELHGLRRLSRMKKNPQEGSACSGRRIMLS